jgi:parallel beta-helix repeat protein
MNFVLLPFLLTRKQKLREAHQGRSRFNGALIYPGILTFFFALNALSAFSQCSFTQDFSNPIDLSATPENGKWYRDRYVPNAFEISSFDGGSRLKQSIVAADCEPCRPATFNIPFYNTQGRKFNLLKETRVIETDIYISSDWTAANKRMAGFWGTAYNLSNVASTAYPIIEYTTEGTARFRGYEGDGSWLDIPNPAGFVTNSWVRLRIELLSNKQFKYSVTTLDNETSTITTTLHDANTAYIGEVIYQGHNTMAGVTYDIYWDNLYAYAGGGVVTNATTSNTYCNIQVAIDAASAGNVINVSPGNYKEDITINKQLTIIGAAPATTIIEGVIDPTSPGNSATVRFASSSSVLAGFTITRAGNNLSDWNNPLLNSGGVAIQGQSISGNTIRDNIIVGNRTGIDINDSNGHTVRNNIITNNHTGVFFRNQTDNITFTENEVTANRTVGILFLDASGGTNIPIQTAIGGNFSNNKIVSNWYAQVVDRQAGGSLPAPGTTNIKNFSGNWFGNTAPAITNANSAEPLYADLIPVEFLGSATAPVGQPDLAGPASANIDYSPLLDQGTDTNVETLGGRGTFGFQGNFASLLVDNTSPKSSAVKHIQEAINVASTGGTIKLKPALYDEDIVVSKAVTIDGIAPASATIKGTYSGSTKTVTVTAAGVTIKNLTVTRDYGADLAAWKTSAKTEGIIVENVDNLTLDNLIVKDHRTGVYLHSSKNSVVKNSDVIRNRTGFQIWGDLTGVQIINNKITDNYTHGIAFNFEQGASIGKNLKIKDNFLSGNWFSQLNMQAASKGQNTGDMSGMDMSCNWVGTSPSYTEAVVTGVPGYDTQVPMQFSGTNTNINTAYSLGGLNASYTTFSSFYNSDGNSATIGFVPTGTCISTVHNTSTSTDYATIQQAINTAGTGNTIRVDAGNYNEQLTIDKSLVFEGAAVGTCGTGTRPTETVLNAPLTGSNQLFSLNGPVTASFDGFKIVGKNIVSSSNPDQNLTFSNSVFELVFLPSSANLYFVSNTLTLDCNYFKAMSGSDDGNVTHIFFAGAKMTAHDNKFTSEEARSSMSSTTNSLPVWLNITTNANNVDIYHNLFTKIDLGILLASNAGNVRIEYNEFDDAQRQSLPYGNNRGAGIALFENLATTGNPIVVRYNKFKSSESGIRTSGMGTQFPTASRLAINFNAFIDIDDKAIAIGSSYSGSTNKLNALCNWFGSVTGPIIGTNVGASGFQLLDGGSRVAFKNWLIYGTDGNTDELGFQLPSSIIVSPGSNTSQAENHYRILSNAIGCAADNQTIDLQGNFDFTNAIAKDEWAKGNDGIAQGVLAAAVAGGDDYSILAPAGRESVTITSTTSATIQGPGDIAATGLEAFLFLNSNAPSATFKNWTISNLAINNFDMAVLADHNGGSVSAMENFKFLNNSILVPKDLHNEDSQNIAIHLNFGKNQEISGNTFTLDGSGVSNGTTAYSTSVALQSTTSGGNAYDNLKIQNNSIHVTGVPDVANPARIIGIWENSNSQSAKIDILGNTFVNDDVNNLPQNNKQLAFRVTSLSGGDDLHDVVYQNNEITGFNRAIDWIGDPFSQYGANPFHTGTKAVKILNNKISNVVSGVTVRKEAGSTNGDSPAIIKNNSFTDIFAGGFAITNTATGTTDATCNWYSEPIAANVISNTGGGVVTFLPKLTHGTDFDGGSVGFQVDAGNNPCILPVRNVSKGTSYLTIQEAISHATTEDLDLIEVSAGIYPENVLVNKQLTITGEDSALVILDKGAANYAFAGGVGFTLEADKITLSKMKVVNYDHGIMTGKVVTTVLIDQMNVNENFSNGFFGKRTVTDLTIQNSNFNGNGYKGGVQSGSASYRRGIMFEAQSSSINNLIIENVNANSNGLVGIDISGLIPTNGIKIHNNRAQNNFDSQIGVALGHNSLSSAATTVTDNNVIVSGTARFGIEIKNPLANGKASGMGSIVVSGNTVAVANHSGTVRDIAGIIVMRRKGNNVPTHDQPEGVQVINNTINDFQNTPGDAFGIVLGGIGHLVAGNIITNSKYSIQLQKGNTNFNSSADAPNSASPEAYFERDNSADVCVEIGSNTITGSGDPRLIVDAAGTPTAIVPVRVTNNDLGTKFCTIQQSINFTATTTGNVLQAIAGDYPENVVMNKSVTVQGPNFAVAGTGSRLTEAVVVPPSEDLTNGVLFNVQSNDVSIKGLTISGSNDAIASTILINGAKTQAAFGVKAAGSIKGLTIENNIIKNLAKHGVDLDALNGSTEGNVIGHNKFDNIPRYSTDNGGSYGRGILLSNNFYVSVLNNTFTRVERGIQTNNFSQAILADDWKIQGNNITAYNIGAFLNLHYQATSDLLFENNTIDRDVTTRTITSGSGDPLPSAIFNGVEVFSIGDAVKVQLKGGLIQNVTNGIYSWNNSSTNHVTVDGVSFNNVNTAVKQSNYSRYANALDSEIDVKGVTIVNGNTVNAFIAEDHADGSGKLSTINLISGNSLTAGATFTHPFVLKGGPKARMRAGGTAVTLSTQDAFTFDTPTGSSDEPNIILNAGLTVNLNGADLRVIDLIENRIMEMGGDFTAPNKVTKNPILINGKLWFNTGILNSGDGSIEFGATGADIMTGAHPEKATSYILGRALLASRAIGAGAIDMLGVNMLAGTNIGNLVITRTTSTSGSIAPAFPADASIRTVWDITASAPSASRGEVQFRYLNLAENVNAQNPAAIYAYRYNIGAMKWEKKSALRASTPTSDIYTTDAFGIAEFSSWTLSSAEPGPDLVLGDLAFFSTSIITTTTQVRYLIVKVSEINGLATNPSLPIEVRISRPSGFNITFDPGATSLSSQTVNNSQWERYNTGSETNVFIRYIGGTIPANGHATFGISYQAASSATLDGNKPITASILSSSGENNLENNSKTLVLNVNIP